MQVLFRQSLRKKIAEKTMYLIKDAGIKETESTLQKIIDILDAHKQYEQFNITLKAAVQKIKDHPSSCPMKLALMNWKANCSSIN